MKRTVRAWLTGRGPLPGSSNEPLDEATLQVWHVLSMPLACPQHALARCSGRPRTVPALWHREPLQDSMSLLARCCLAAAAMDRAAT